MLVVVLKVLVSVLKMLVLGLVTVILKVEIPVGLVVMAELTLHQW